MSRELPQPLHQLHQLDVALPWPPRRCTAQPLPLADDAPPRPLPGPQAEPLRLRRAYVAGWRYGLLCGTVAGGLAALGLLQLLG